MAIGAPKVQVKADLTWVPHEDGVRSTSIPFQMAGFTYWATARVDGLDKDWSVGVDLSPGCGCFFVGFLVEHAPHEVWESGKKFEIKEGNRVVARGVVR